MMNKILFISLYDPNNGQRLDEFRQCFEKNMEIFDRIVVLFEGEERRILAFIKNADIYYIDNRPTYNTFFEIINKYYLNKIAIIANCDIYFDKSIHNIDKVNLDNKFVCLTRYNKIGDELQFQTKEICAACTDAWIFQSPINFNGDYILGISYCDGRISAEAHKAGFEVVNFSKSIRITHLHEHYMNPKRYDYRYKGESLYVYIQNIDEETKFKPELIPDL